MKHISIITKSNNEIVIKDNNTNKLSKYCKTLSEILSHGNVSILQTDNEAIIIKPSNIEYFKIVEVITNEDDSITDID